MLFLSCFISLPLWHLELGVPAEAPARAGAEARIVPSLEIRNWVYVKEVSPTPSPISFVNTILRLSPLLHLFYPTPLPARRTGHPVTSYQDARSSEGAPEGAPGAHVGPEALFSRPRVAFAGRPRSSLREVFIFSLRGSGPPPQAGSLSLSWNPILSSGCRRPSGRAEDLGLALYTPK